MGKPEKLDAPIFHTAIIGAGASGLFCAGSFQAHKIVLEANALPACKVAVSGGGKCNFSNRFISASNYESQNKHFCKNALAAFRPEHFTALLDAQNIPWEERTHGRLFAKSAKDIVRFLVHRAQKNNTHLALGTRVLNLRQENGLFLLSTSAGPVRARHLVLATGGLSFPSLGGSSFGIKMARQLGLRTQPQRPVLCGLSFPKELRTRLAPLAGNSLPVVLRQGKYSVEDDLLFTHQGISGPSTLQLSLFWKPQLPVEINFLPDHAAAEIFMRNKNSRQLLSTVLSPYLPGKTAKILLHPWDAPLCNATRAQLHAAEQTLHHFQFVPEGTSGYTKAEATAGGVDTREINPSTFEVRNVKNLFITGELLDVTGNLGGFNLHWAWASAFLAAQALKQRL